MFDSGVGGLTVARAVLNQLPGEQILYIGDTAHSPYGPRPIEEVRRLALGVMDELVDSGVKMLVIACNTASAAVLHDARSRYTQGRGVPVVEVIHPAARAAARWAVVRPLLVAGRLAPDPEGRLALSPRKADGEQSDRGDAGEHSDRSDRAGEDAALPLLRIGAHRRLTLSAVCDDVVVAGLICPQGLWPLSLLIEGTVVPL